MRSWLKPILLAFLFGVLIGPVRLHRSENPEAIARARTASTEVESRPEYAHPAAKLETATDSAFLANNPPQAEAKRSAASLDKASVPEPDPGLPTITLMENMRSVFRAYCARFGGNPVGTNREITARLNGGNRKQVVFLKPEDGMRMNAQGELVDNWGTPFFFHQLSNTEMEIHSAGPDRQMWTADDLVMK
jgi:hypothetical protein